MNSRLTILHLRASNFIGGPEKQLLEHFSRIDQSRFRLILTSFHEHGTENDLVRHAGKSGFACYSLDAAGSFSPKMISQLIRLIRTENVHIICTHGYKANVVGRIAAWISGIPEISVARGWTGESFRIKAYEALDKLFLRFADHIVAVSEEQKRRITRLGVSPKRLSVIYNSIATDGQTSAAPPALRSELGIDEGTILVVSAGRLSPEKNFSGLIDVAEIINKKRQDIVFVIFGEGIERKLLQKKIEGRGLSHNMYLPGFRTNLSDILCEADIFALSSFTEGMPNVVLEAYAQKKPVVATAVGGTPEVVLHGRNGFLASPAEPHVMAEHIMVLADNPALRARFGQAGFDLVKSRFTFEQQTMQFEELYHAAYHAFYHGRHACAE